MTLRQQRKVAQTIGILLTMLVPLIVLSFMFAASPLPLFGPLASPLLMPARGPTVFPLAPVSRRDVVIPHRYEQDGSGHELGSDDDPRAVVSRAHVPAAISKGPVLTIVEEQIGELGRRGRHVLDPWRLGDDNEWWRCRKMDPGEDKVPTTIAGLCHGVRAATFAAAAL